MSNETIVAQCTPRGPGAIALIRVSGPKAFSVVSQCSRLTKKAFLSEKQSHTVKYGWVIKPDGTVIDQVLFLLMRGPKTFSGYDTIEISCHNNQFIIQAIIERALECGARLAAGGEFTRQAIENGKVDLLQAEAINELIHAQSIATTQAGMAQLRGSLSHEISIIETQILKALSFCQASFEFIDDEIEFFDQIQALLKGTISQIDTLLTIHQQSVQIKQGIKVVLIGSVNAGKSSLFNALLESDRAIVTHIAGTTRDVIEASTVCEGAFITFADTAGIRCTQDIIEQHGIDRSLRYAQAADIVLLVYDTSQILSRTEQVIYDDIKNQLSHKIITVGSKSDLAGSQVTQTYAINVSSKTRHNITSLKALLLQRIKNAYEHLNCPFLINQRHATLLKTVHAQLHDLCNNKDHSCIEYEILSLELTTTLSHLADLTGKDISEKTMDMIFAEFCVGK